MTLPAAAVALANDDLQTAAAELATPTILPASLGGSVEAANLAHAGDILLKQGLSQKLISLGIRDPKRSTAVLGAAQSNRTLAALSRVIFARADRGFRGVVDGAVRAGRCHEAGTVVEALVYELDQARQKEHVATIAAMCIKAVEGTELNPIGRLYELRQAGRTDVDISDASPVGADSASMTQFYVTARIGEHTCEGFGRSKKAAKHAAASGVLELARMPPSPAAQDKVYLPPTRCCTSADDADWRRVAFDEPCMRYEPREGEDRRQARAQDSGPRPLHTAWLCCASLAPSTHAPTHPRTLTPTHPHTLAPSHARTHPRTHAPTHSRGARVP